MEAESEVEVEVEDVIRLKKYQSAAVLNELSVVVAEEARESAILIESTAVKEDVIEVQTKKSAVMLAKNLGAASRVDVTEELVEEIERTVELTEAGKLLPLEMPPLESMKGEEFIRFRQRGSIAPIRRSSMFPLPSTGGRASSVADNRRRIELTDASLHLSGSITLSADSELRSFDQLGTHTVQVEVTPPTSVSLIETAMFLWILEECVHQLDVIGTVIPARIVENWDYSPQTIDEKYSVPDEPRTIFREDMGLPPLIATAAEKLQRERTYACEILNSTIRDLKHLRQFDTLEGEVGEIAKSKDAERSLEATCQLWKTQVAQIREDLLNEKQSHERKLKRISEMAFRVNGHVDTAIFVNGSRLGFVERWENARLEQQNLILTMKEQELIRDINQSSKMQSVDQIISNEVCAYLEEDISKLQNETELWTDRYNEELTQRQQEIDELKERVEEQKLEMQDLYVLRDEYQLIIEERNAQLERERAEEEYQAMINRAAVVIQSAWRGYMVRHQLGPYKNLRSRLRKRKRKAKRARRKASALRKKKELEMESKKSKR